jgi:hypothetical protein
MRWRAARAREYDPNQPRVPAGNPDGGQWTDDPRWAGGVQVRPLDSADIGQSNEDDRIDSGGFGPGASFVLSDVTPDNFFKPGARFAQNDTSPIFSIDLHEERRFGGHTIDKHVNKTAEALIAQAREAFQSNPRAQDSRSGSFSSLESAT